ncbi:5'-3' exonuclease, N-terminal resolvase family domain-containing protein [Besnoitia besnoiti]|uniref:5'-3' exonuclease, N-terminal resolvase family domain-containing protein n=1 Tax=Besnoitia besnoiti TaxID=94643 RepID=A0A2A9MDF0_BESBE|nr:5'-3' exonuclease, N-terminal resolvase family domain-containing protein [Besnoitia besnoiti]PFH33410.1 5'-3' exonuclease, N-terminal resolvase family domain-containing protein [Besnoitia besnoiti]
MKRFLLFLPIFLFSPSRILASTVAGIPPLLLLSSHGFLLAHGCTVASFRPTRSPTVTATSPLFSLCFSTRNESAPSRSRLLFSAPSSAACVASAPLPVSRPCLERLQLSTADEEEKHEEAACVEKTSAAVMPRLVSRTPAAAMLGGAKTLLRRQRQKNKSVPSFAEPPWLAAASKGQSAEDSLLLAASAHEPRRVLPPKARVSLLRCLSCPPDAETEEARRRSAVVDSASRSRRISEEADARASPSFLSPPGGPLCDAPRSPGVPESPFALSSSRLSCVPSSCAAAGFLSSSRPVFFALCGRRHSSSSDRARAEGCVSRAVESPLSPASRSSLLSTSSRGFSSPLSSFSAAAASALPLRSKPRRVREKKEPLSGLAALPPWPDAAAAASAETPLPPSTFLSAECLSSPFSAPLRPPPSSASRAASAASEADAAAEGDAHARAKKRERKAKARKGAESEAKSARVTESTGESSPARRACSDEALKAEAAQGKTKPKGGGACLRQRAAQDKEKKKNRHGGSRAREEGEKKKILAVIDGTCVAFRSHFGMPEVLDGGGVPIQAIIGFFRSLAAIRRALLNPSHLVVVFDGPESRESRKAIFDGYKGHRSETPPSLTNQFGVILRLCQQMEIGILSEPGVEADDVIATLVSRACKTSRAAAAQSLAGAGRGGAEEPDLIFDEIVVATADKDLLQVLQHNYMEPVANPFASPSAVTPPPSSASAAAPSVEPRAPEGGEGSEEVAGCASGASCTSPLEGEAKERKPFPKIRIMQLHKKMQLVDHHWVQMEYGVSAHQIRDYLALTGDTVDGVTGCQGVGPVTAQKIIATAGGNVNALLQDEAALRRFLKPSQVKHLSNFTALFERNQHLISLNYEVESLSGLSLSRFEVKKRKAGSSGRLTSSSCFQGPKKHPYAYLLRKHERTQDGDGAKSQTFGGQSFSAVGVPFFRNRFKKETRDRREP